MNGKGLKSLMRKNKVTIRELKKRTGITLKQIRVRLNTVEELPLMIVLDYLDGIGLKDTPWHKEWLEVYKRGEV